jgi:hypothetical protein
MPYAKRGPHLTMDDVCCLVSSEFQFQTLDRIGSCLNELTEWHFIQRIKD